MANHLSEQEFADLVEEISRGEKSLNVTRSLSRHFYLHVGTRNVRDLTNESVIGSKILILGLLITSVALMLGCLGLLVNEFRWGALIAVPFAGIFWTVIAGFTTELGSWLSSTVILIVESARRRAGVTQGRHELAVARVELDGLAFEPIPSGVEELLHLV